MTIAGASTRFCGVIILLAALSCGTFGWQYGGGNRKIRHDHKGQTEGTQSGVDFEFETTRGVVYDDYDDSSEDATLDVVHGLYDTRKGIVPNIVYQGTVKRFLNFFTIIILREILVVCAIGWFFIFIFGFRAMSYGLTVALLPCLYPWPLYSTFIRGEGADEKTYLS